MILCNNNRVFKKAITVKKQGFFYMFLEINCFIYYEKKIVLLYNGLSWTFKKKKKKLIVTA